MFASKYLLYLKDGIVNLHRWEKRRVHLEEEAVRNQEASRFASVPSQREVVLLHDIPIIVLMEASECLDFGVWSSIMMRSGCQAVGTGFGAPRGAPPATSAAEGAE